MKSQWLRRDSDRGSQSSLARTARLSAILVVGLSCADLRGDIIAPGGLLAVTNTHVLERFSFAGAHLQDLTITGLPSGAVPQGVSVVGARLFVGIVNQSGPANPRIAEINPGSGAVINTMNTALPSMTALGDDGVHLLLLDSVNVFNTYTYTLDGTLVSAVQMQRPFSGTVQAYGIDGDGHSIFTSYYSGSQPIVTNTIAGAAVTFFPTNMNSLTDTIHGLAYDGSDQTFWAAGVNEFRHYSSAGTLLATIPGGTTITGLEVLPFATVPEPGSICGWSLTGLGFSGYLWRRHRRGRLPK